MRGIPQELFQRLAQELLRQVRLEAALDPPSAITLATEEAAAAREEAGPIAPATTEQAKPEQIPRLIYPFMQRLAQPATDATAGPATNLAQPPPSGNRQSPQPVRTTRHHRQRNSHQAAQRGISVAVGARRASRISRRNHPGPFPNAGNRGGPRRLPPGVPPREAGTRGGIPTKNCRRKGGPSHLPRRARPSSGPTRVGSCSGAGESGIRSIPASNRFGQCGAAKAARGSGGEPLADPKGRPRRSWRTNTATQALPCLRARRDHWQRTGAQTEARMALLWPGRPKMRIRAVYLKRVR